jgi:peptidoglycan/LPS O-acetylase OafA/YrhL
VFLHHSPVFPGGSRAAAFVKDMGWVGVDLFFVLSAYLLIALLQKEYAVTGAHSHATAVMGFL